MKKVFIMFLGLAMMLPMSAMARHNGGGFVDDNQAQKIVTVSDLKDMHDDTYVKLQGFITEKVAHEKYTFKDKTGTVSVEIDDDDWNGLTVGPSDEVVIEGEFDKNWTSSNEIEVEVIRLAR